MKYSFEPEDINLIEEACAFLLRHKMLVFSSDKKAIFPPPEINHLRYIIDCISQQQTTFLNKAFKNRGIKKPMLKNE